MIVKGCAGACPSDEGPARVAIPHSLYNTLHFAHNTF